MGVATNPEFEATVNRGAGGRFDRQRTGADPTVLNVEAANAPEIVPWEVGTLRPGMTFKTYSQHYTGGPLGFQMRKDKHLRRLFHRAGYPEALTVLEKRRWEFDPSETLIVVELDGEKVDVILNPHTSVDVVIDDQDEFDKLFE